MTFVPATTVMEHAVHQGDVHARKARVEDHMHDGADAVTVDATTTPSSPSEKGCAHVTGLCGGCAEAERGTCAKSCVHGPLPSSSASPAADANNNHCAPDQSTHALIDTNYRTDELTAAAEATRESAAPTLTRDGATPELTAAEDACADQIASTRDNALSDPIDSSNTGVASTRARNSNNHSRRRKKYRANRRTNTGVMDSSADPDCAATEQQTEPDRQRCNNSKQHTRYKTSTNAKMGRNGEADAAEHVGLSHDGDSYACEKENKGMERRERQDSPWVADAALFLWERVASMCPPRTVVGELERLCRAVRHRLEESNTGTRWMQRYWNAQWARLLWPEEAISESKRLLLPHSISRSEGQKSWRLAYRQELPLWVQRTYQGHGIVNNAANDARVLFRREKLNESKTGKQLAAQQLSAHEAIAKIMQKRGIAVELDASATSRSSNSVSVNSRQDTHGGSSYSKRSGNDSGGANSAGGGGGNTDKKLTRIMERAVTSRALDREMYQVDRRQATRKEKHAKGRQKKWEGYDNFGDYEY